MDRKRRNELLDQDPRDLSYEELAEILTERYAPTVIPPCCVCGGELSMQSFGGGQPTVWACSGMEDDPDEPGRIRMMKGRRPADEHYSKSRFEDLRRGGDELVIEAIRRMI